MKLQVSLNDTLVARIDKVAKENYMSRSGLISQATSTYLGQLEMVIAVRDLSLAMNKIADKGEIDPETKEKLEDFTRLANLLAKQ